MGGPSDPERGKVLVLLDSVVGGEMKVGLGVRFYVSTLGLEGNGAE